jgi:peptidoglycan/xylan/chitin deacetylase (PgdA/CDA1 family)
VSGKVTRFIFHQCGGIHLSRHVHRKGARILMYHRFFPQYVNRAEQQMAHLRRYYRVTSLTALGKLLKEGSPLPEKTVVVTVDDGYKDFYETAYPIFRKFGIPAILFLTTGYLDRKCWLWVDRVMYILQNTRKPVINIPISDSEPLRLKGGPEHGPASAGVLKLALKRLNFRTRDRMLLELEELAGVCLPEQIPPEYEPCTWDQIREMARNGIEFGAHTLTHPILSTIDDAAKLRAEMVESQRRIEEELQTPVRHFAYPNGRWSDFGMDSVKIARENFDTAVSAISGWNYRETDRHQLFRLGANPETPFDFFQRNLAGVSASTRKGQPRLPVA